MWEVLVLMSENSFGDFFLSDSDDEIGVQDESPATPVVVPVEVAPDATRSQADAPTAGVTGDGTGPSAAVPGPVTSAPADPVYAVPSANEPAPAGPEPIGAPVVSPTAARQAPSGPTREQRLADALNRLMSESPEIQAAALVSLDGFTMASALPEGMQEDRVGAMSAAILGLGDRAAAELGRGRLSQVFIQGEGGYVLLMAAGTRAALTCLANEDAKLGLVLYDMRAAAESIAQVLG